MHQARHDGGDEHRGRDRRPAAHRLRRLDHHRRGAARWWAVPGVAVGRGRPAHRRRGATRRAARLGGRAGPALPG
ncbi:hypothetical protein EAD89_25130 [Micromonospora sp. BL4]|nr:hypothetical protein EAD89_25130 [Micromonospora sp. BL4]